MQTVRSRSSDDKGDHFVVSGPRNGEIYVPSGYLVTQRRRCPDRIVVGIIRVPRRQLGHEIEEPLRWLFPSVLNAPTAVFEVGTARIEAQAWLPAIKVRSHDQPSGQRTPHRVEVAVERRAARYSAAFGGEAPANARACSMVFRASMFGTAMVL